jgi:hypothetical protein
MGLTEGLTFILISPLEIVYVLVFASPNNSAFRKIVWAHFKFNTIAENGFDARHAKLSRNISRKRVTI